MNEDILTQRTRLRKYTEEDREIVADFFTDDDIGRYMGDGPSDTRQDAYTLFDKIFEIYNGSLATHKYFEIWGIEYENELIGHFELKETEHTLKNELEVVYLLDKDYWGKGILPEILTAIHNHAKIKNKILIATLNQRNHSSMRVLEKVGIAKLNNYKDKNYLKVTLKKNLG